MNILLVNDDGVFSIGIRTLAKHLSKNNKVIIVAPDSNRSAFSQALTVGRPVTLTKMEFDDNIESYATSGTPTDSVKLAHHLLKDFKIDLVVSGINDGFNIGTDTFYSGTVSAAIEGNILGYKSIAFSIPYKHAEYIEFYAQKAVEIIDKINKLPNCVYNVNFPEGNPDCIKGIKMSKVGIAKYADSYVPSRNSDGYYLTGELCECEKNTDDCDVVLIQKGYVTISPISVEKTDYKILEQIKGDF